MAYAQATLSAIEGDVPPEAKSTKPSSRDMVDDHSQYVTQLFEQYRRPLMRYLTDLLSSPDDAEDIVQETYVRLLKAQELDRSGSRIRGYIFKIATNLAYDRFRHRKVTGEKIPYEDTKTYEDTNLVGSNPQPDRIVDFEQGLQLVKQALLELKPRCRQVFLMRALEHLSYQDIAERLGIGTRTAEREMKHAIEFCQIKLRIQQRI